ncbi:hypothetical protein ABEF95_012563 [Exophiala dermatitidis]
MPGTDVAQISQHQSPQSANNNGELRQDGSQSRRRQPKSRAGCNTCKAKRMKCDGESWPESEPIDAVSATPVTEEFFASCTAFPPSTLIPCVADSNMSTNLLTTSRSQTILFEMLRTGSRMRRL